MAKYAPAALVAVLLLATGAAFLHTESLKLETSPIRKTRVTKTFSPVCRCDSSKARIAFRLAKPDVVSVAIVDDSGTDVRRLVTARPERGLVALLWNGRDDAGRLVPDGSYRPRARLELLEKTFLLPNVIDVDTRRPGIQALSVRPRVFSPDGDRQADYTSVRYRVDEPARALLYVDRVQRVVGASLAPVGALKWYGKVGDITLPARRYALALVAVDRAGNRSRPVGAGPVLIRYIELRPGVVRARPGTLVRLRVLTDARRVTWRLAKRQGTARPPLLRVRAPRQPGRYRLVVVANDHRARAVVVVQAT